MLFTFIETEISFFLSYFFSRTQGSWIQMVQVVSLTFPGTEVMSDGQKEKGVSTI